MGQDLKREGKKAQMENGSLLSPAGWAQRTFGDVRLGDKRRNERAVRLATLMARHP
jgi:hypothetical protein